MNNSGVEENFFKAIVHPERATDPALRTITHAFIYLWRQAQHYDISPETYKGMRHIFNQAWIECDTDIQEKWEL